MNLLFSAYVAIAILIVIYEFVVWLSGSEDYSIIQNTIIQFDENPFCTFLLLAAFWPLFAMAVPVYIAWMIFSKSVEWAFFRMRHKVMRNMKKEIPEREKGYNMSLSDYLSDSQ